MYKEYLKRKWEWVDENPRTAAWLGWMKGIIFGIGVSLFCLTCSSKEPAVQTTVNTGVGTSLCLDALDSVGCIYHWEVIGDTLYISTVEDEIQNELLRLQEIKDLYYE